ncbi:MAG: asparagine synthase (glutamine-hydrolyzing) [Candidatus Methylomirabilales bacterium]
MCGIVGIVCQKTSGTEDGCVQKMCTLLARRGPDGEGYYLGDRVALGMRRLAIIDVEGGHQPVHNEDQSIWVVFNGEIYNYQELHKDLEKRGHRFSTRSDTECLVHLYEDFGDECVSHLRGMFAFAIWDDRRKRLLLARDRLGIKPLYYWCDADRLAFASEMKSLLTLKGFECRMNLEAMSAFFTFMYVPGPMTIYEGIYEIPPAHVGVWMNGNLQLKRYWDVEPKPDFDKPIEFFTEGLLHHLRESVRLRLISEVPLGAFLSGGIDSSTIVALMGQTSGQKAKTFTVGFTGNHSAYDERPFARAVAEAFGTNHSECLLSAQVEEILPAIIRAFDEPFADSSAIPNYLICQAARQWVTVALSGLGGDELFAGYERYRGALLADYYRRVPRALRQGIIDPVVRGMPESRNGGLWRDRLKRFIQGTELELTERYQRYIAAYDDAEKAELFSGDLVYELERRGLNPTQLAMQKAHDALDPLDRMLLTDIHTYLPHDLLRMTDRLSMWHSLEVRVPFLDHKLVEFVATIPARYKLRRWQKKHILIRALDGILPKTILKRRKQGFSIPLNSWLRGPLRDLAQQYLAEPALQKVGLFDPQTVARILNQHDQGFRNHESKIWVLLTFMLWHDLYMRKQPM